ncbi:MULTISPECIES: helicase-related protein [unclassified Nocardioides]|uniref:helicase-related protein n=1 Tax=unclassified Nocardioides TaxID=2615069 RepID=UPI000056FA84|nr:MULTISPECIES: helicase-related protein [unclassified Nocardioides]ABL79357.1 helicase domain protein [Nocardioides sp. JS614]
MTSPAPLDVAVGSLVRARGREWVVLPGTTPDFVLLQPLGGGSDDVVGVFPDEGVEHATFPPPTAADLGDSASTALLRTALRVGFTAGAGPFRSLAGISVSPRSYQYVPLLMALRQETVRLLIADDVGIGKTIEAGLIAAELLAQGTVRRLAVLCSPALAEQWQRELATKFGIDAALVLTSTVKRLERGLMLNESLFDRYPHVIVSTDFIKSARRRHDFLLRCPELVIVDEAHNCVAGAGVGHRSRHQRYELLRDLAADATRHLVMATATPHSGDEAAFTNLVGLCNPELATADLSSEKGRRLLAQHFVQRRRADIRHYLDEDTPFPKDRLTLDVPYTLSPAYRDLFDDVLAYAREQVRDGVDGTRGRVRWWSVLALLRALASSPQAAAATLRTRAANAEATTAQEADELGRAAVLDSADDESLEGIDTTPGALTDDETSAGTDTAERRRLLGFARRAADLAGPDHDRKLAAVTTQVKKLLADGYSPIVFCRFIDTAHYVAAHLNTALGTKRNPVHVVSVTGELPPAERERRVGELTELDGEHVLVATDCLSEGVNLQEHFSAVVHYDLCWNPTRHEQREGRVDRYLQRKEVVRAVTLYGEDNGIDGIVLDVLIRRHRAIAKATGVAVPVPGDGQGLIDALAEGLLLRRQDSRDQLVLDLGLDERTQQLEDAWTSAAEQEKVSRTRYAQHAIKPEEVAAEVEELHAALGTHGDLETFLTGTLRALGSTLTTGTDAFTAVTATLPLGLRTALPVGIRDPLPFHSEPPAGRGEAVIARTDPTVQAIARYVLESALDPTVPAPERPARRAGVMRTRAVQTRTTLLLVRFRFQLELPASDGVQQRVAEDARVLAFEGTPSQALWLPDDRAEDLLSATPTANVIEGAAHDAISKVLDGLSALTPHLESVADEHADRLLGAHRRARTGAGAARRGLAVTAQRPVDVLSVQLFLPDLGGAS